MMQKLDRKGKLFGDCLSGLSDMLADKLYPIWLTISQYRRGSKEWPLLRYLGESHSSFGDRA
ncbi:MAG: hypothetical protein F6J93_08480 [Oscillatoria sp. SIO1A7]|nr:hypothetical protein [Oscillatoria sp. SIO1A7]